MQLESKPRYRCRNPRCRSKLKEPVENMHAAFCTRGCWDQFHRHRCVVCERSFNRTVENKRLCERRTCRAEMKRWPALYLPFQPKTANLDKPGTSEPKNAARLPSTGKVQAGAQKAREIRTKTGTKSLRGWYWVENFQKGFKSGVDNIEQRSLNDRNGRLAARIAQEGEGWWVAYPAMIPEPPIEPLQAAIKRAETVVLWALPLDPATAQRIRAANRAVWRDRRLVTELQQADPDLPVVQSKWTPSAALRDFSDFPDIPVFLKRSESLPTIELSPPLVPAEQPAEVDANAS